MPDRPSSIEEFMEGTLKKRYHASANEHGLDAQGDVERLFDAHTSELLVVQHPREREFARLLIRSASGVWREGRDTLKAWHDELGMALFHEPPVLDDAGLTPRAVQSHVRRSRTRTGFEEMLANVGPVYVTMQRLGVLPDGLWHCFSTELDADFRFLGAPNGVIDLKTGALLTGDDAARQLVTREVAVAFDPDAPTDAPDAVFGHLSVEDREWFLDSVGFALQGHPSRRINIIEGPKGGGKTTALNAITECLGEYAGQTGANTLLKERFVPNANSHTEHLRPFTESRIVTCEELDANGRPNEAFLKTISGGGKMNFRGIHDRTDRDIRSISGTLFVAVNEGAMKGFQTLDAALGDRLLILPYPELDIPPEERDALFVERVQSPEMQTSMLAEMVRRSVQCWEKPPRAIQSVRERARKRLEESLGVIGTWIRNNIIVTLSDNDRIQPDDLWETLAHDIPPDKNGLIEGQDPAGFKRMLRQIYPEFPVAKRVRMPDADEPGKRVTMYIGVRWAGTEEVVDQEGNAF